MWETDLLSTLLKITYLTIAKCYIIKGTKCIDTSKLPKITCLALGSSPPTYSGFSKLWARNLLKEGEICKIYQKKGVLNLTEKLIFCHHYFCRLVKNYSITIYSMVSYTHERNVLLLCNILIFSWENMFRFGSVTKCTVVTYSFFRSLLQGSRWKNKNSEL